MTATRHVLSAVATLALSFTVIAGEAQAQFGMGMGMGRGMGMGMGGGMMGMRGMGMGRSMYMSEPPSGYHRRSYRSRDYDDDDRPSRGAKSRKKEPVKVVVPAKPAPKPVVAQPLKQFQPVQTVQPATTVAPVVTTTQAPAAVVTTTTQAATQQTPPAATTQANAAAATQQSTDSALPTRLTPETRPLNCTTKMHLKDGTILWQDFCTLEQAILKQGSGTQIQQAVTPPAPTAPQPLQAQPQPLPTKSQQTPAQLARSR
jgi:hypothetical protein